MTINNKKKKAKNKFKKKKKKIVIAIKRRGNKYQMKAAQYVAYFVSFGKACREARASLSSGARKKQGAHMIARRFGDILLQYSLLATLRQNKINWHHYYLMPFEN